MNFDLSDEQKILADQVRRLLAKRSSYDHLRELIGTGAAWDEPLWHEFANLGFLRASIPEVYGGMGLSALDCGVINAEIGRANAALPFFSSLVLCAGAIQVAGSESQRQRWLPELAAGKTVGTMAYADTSRMTVSPSTVDYADGRISGVATPIADAGAAQIAIIPCKQGEQLVLVLVRLEQPQVTRRQLQSFDLLRPHYRIEFENAAAELLDATPATAALGLILDRAAVQVAFEAVGGAEACVYMARDYAMHRQIFGRPLAGYQSIKHKLADLLAALELARSSAYYAGWTASEGSEELPKAAAAARLTSLVAFEQAARENLQVHGGIGYTFEANCHFYYRRERTLALGLGGREIWSDRLIDTLRRTGVA